MDKNGKQKPLADPQTTNGAHIAHIKGGGQTMDAILLLQDIKAKRRTPESLSIEQRRACLMLMANGKQTLSEIAHVLHVTRDTIARDLRKVRSRLGKEVKNYTTEIVLGQLAHCAEKFTSLALKQEDTALAWSIQRDFVRTLKELGILGKQEATDGLKITIETLGSGYERARDALAKHFDPRLTGEVIDAEDYTIVDKEQDTSIAMRMPLTMRRPDAPTEPTNDVKIIKREGPTPDEQRAAHEDE
jgi:predicted HTH transcriptional regulator